MTVLSVTYTASFFLSLSLFSFALSLLSLHFVAACGAAVLICRPKKRIRKIVVLPPISLQRKFLVIFGLITSGKETQDLTATISQRLTTACRASLESIQIHSTSNVFVLIVQKVRVFFFPFLFTILTTFVSHQISPV
jgi:hypothetical protein